MSEKLDLWQAGQKNFCPNRMPYGCRTSAETPFSSNSGKPIRRLCQTSTGCLWGRRTSTNQSFTSASMQEDLRREARRHAFQLAGGKDEPEKNPSDYQSAVARHLAESKECAMAFSDSSFRVVRAFSVEFEPRNHGGSVH